MNSKIKEFAEQAKNSVPTGLDTVEWIAKYNHNQKLINELYEAEMIKQGFEKGEDGDFYKTIIVRKRTKKNII